MDAEPSSPSHAGPRVRKRRLGARGFAVLLVVVVVAVLCARWVTGIRQSAVRMKTQIVLRSVAQAAEAYQQQFGSSPALDDLLAGGMVDGKMLEEFSRCEVAGVPGEPVVFDAWLVQTEPCRAVKKGEAWGGPGETIDHDLPACRYVLMKDWSVRDIDESAYQREVAGRVRLTPVR